MKCIFGSVYKHLRGIKIMQKFVDVVSTPFNPVQLAVQLDGRQSKLLPVLQLEACSTLSIF